VRLVRTREQLEKVSDKNEMEVMYKNLLNEVNQVLADSNFPQIKWVH